MKPAILFYSFTGNNRLVSRTLAKRLDCPLVEVRPRGRRFTVTIVFDMLLKRFPKVRAVDLPPHDHLLVVTPLWNRWIAHPMRTALRGLGADIGPYSFLSASGGFREGQVAFVDEQLLALTGRAPAHHWSIYVEQVVPDDIKGTVKVSSFRLSAGHLAKFPELDEIAHALGT